MTYRVEPDDVTYRNTTEAQSEPRHLFLSRTYSSAIICYENKIVPKSCVFFYSC